MPNLKQKGYKMSTEIKWTDEALIAEAMKYTSRKELQDHNDSAYVTILKREGLRDIAFAHMIRPFSGKWTEELIRKEALKYTSRKDFHLNSKGASARASATGILDDVCSHMVTKRTSWTPLTIRVEALKYTTKEEFRLNAYPAYLKATRLGIADEVMIHMIPPSRNATRILPDVPTHMKGIYILYKDKEIIYIGKSNDCISNRLRQHLKRPIPYTDATIYEIKSEADINVIEIYLISMHQPYYNADGKTTDKLSLEILNLNNVITQTIQINVKEQLLKSTTYKV